MVGVLTAALLLVLLAGLVAWAVSVPSPSADRRLSARDRARQSNAIAAARWTTAHDEVHGTTRILLRRTCTGLDGRPEVLEERVFETFPARDPLWEARFTEAMSNARFRCSYLNAEEGRAG